MTPEWKDAFKYATILADQLGMEEAIAGSPGWSESGGPWVPASAGHEEICVERNAGRRAASRSRESWLIRRRTPAHFRTWPSRMLIARRGLAPIPQFYADAAVVAYRRPADRCALESLHPKMTASGGSPDFAMLSDGDLEKTTKLPIPAVARAPGSNMIRRAADHPRHITYRRSEEPDRVRSRCQSAAPEKPWKRATTGKTFRHGGQAA